MKQFKFTILLKNANEKTPNLEDRLYEASCGDALIHFRSGAVYLEFSREAVTLDEAVASAVKNIQQSKFVPVIV
ncbi:MAG TPA: hypothetical protein VFU82_00765 [Gammaproteobacteria bacterium]|jgi:hypothetical protein|nr:hypothetical protein [Gammaproteobacteria bacterium]